MLKIQIFHSIIATLNLFLIYVVWRFYKYVSILGDNALSVFYFVAFLCCLSLSLGIIVNKLYGSIHLGKEVDFIRRAGVVVPILLFLIAVIILKI